METAKAAKRPDHTAPPFDRTVAHTEPTLANAASGAVLGLSPLETSVVLSAAKPTSPAGPDRAEMPPYLDFLWWAQRDSNPRHLPCKGSALAN
jgi:hypothetical protein